MLHDLVGFNPSYAKILELIGSGGKRVLEVGSASGYLARRLGEQGCTVTGLAFDAEAAAKAVKYYAHTKVADLETEDLAAPFGDEKFETIVFCDALERLRDPWRVLDRARALLQDGGFVVASIPNIAHGAIRLSLMSGEFNYSEFGILDSKHLRFFTRRTVGELFVRSGFTIERIERALLPLFSVSELVPHVEERSYQADTIARVRQDPECETLQFVVKARALDDQAKVEQLTRAYVAVNVELSAADERQSARADEKLEAERSTLRGQLRILEQKIADLNVLQARAIDETFTLRQASVTASEANERLTSHNKDLAKALRLASEQVDELHAQRFALEQFCSRLGAECEDCRSQATSAARVMHEYLSDFADPLGNIGDVAERKRTIQMLRSSQPLLLAEIESLEAVLREQDERRLSETAGQNLPRPAPRQGSDIWGRLLRRVLRRRRG